MGLYYGWGMILRYTASELYMVYMEIEARLYINDTREIQIEWLMSRIQYPKSELGPHLAQCKRTQVGP